MFEKTSFTYLRRKLKNDDPAVDHRTCEGYVFGLIDPNPCIRPLHPPPNLESCAIEKPIPSLVQDVYSTEACRKAWKQIGTIASS